MKLAAGLKGAGSLAIAAVFSHSAVTQQVAAETASTLGDKQHPTLQSLLDAKCTEHFKSLCASNSSALRKEDCSGGEVVARFGSIGQDDADKKSYACYLKNTMDLSDVQVYCLDDCLKNIPCQGSVTPRTVKVPVGNTMLRWGEEYKKEHCSPRQEWANKECMFIRSNFVARFDRGHKGQDEFSWRCYNAASLRFERLSVCADNCRGVVPCAGGRADPTSTNHKTIPDRLLRSMDMATFPCAAGEVCEATRSNPPKCRPPLPGEDADLQRTQQVVTAVEVREGQQVTLDVPKGTPTLSVELGNCHSVQLQEGGRIAFKSGGSVQTTSFDLGAGPKESFRLSLGYSNDKISVWLNGQQNDVRDAGYTVRQSGCGPVSRFTVHGPAEAGMLTSVVEAFASSGGSTEL
ncbi:microneme protein 13 [Cystoisospora suis]|uniref:Microneme protein 13 n=1 Tax=Cystoisospora suis TaxID=483139 RepID=A0A2C6L4R7_9APIC|nr:microneme protein 13 [Cystoisospora suis]